MAGNCSTLKTLKLVCTAVNPFALYSPQASSEASPTPTGMWPSGM